LAAFSSYMCIEKQCLYEKFVRKMLMKLTPGRLFSITNDILWILFRPLLAINH